MPDPQGSYSTSKSHSRGEVSTVAIWAGKAVITLFDGTGVGLWDVVTAYAATRLEERVGLFNELH